MKAKRWISLLLAVSMMLGVLAMPASAAAQQPESTAVVSEELPDATALSAAEDENDTLLEYLEEIPQIEEYCNLKIDSIKIKNNAEKEESVQLFVVPDNETLDGYIRLEDASGNLISLAKEGILVTQNAANILGFDVGDTVQLQKRLTLPSQPEKCDCVCVLRTTDCG